MPKASVILSFYNNITALKCIVRSLEIQESDIEIVIADDGSKSEIVEQVDMLIATAKIPIKRVSQLDNGFRKNRALNKAISKSSSDYLIFIDGDCIPQASFVDDHLAKKESGFVLNGRRADIPSSLKDELLSSEYPHIFFKKNTFRIFSLYLLGKGKNIEKGFRIPFNFLLKKLNAKEKGLVGCNFSIHKCDLLAINGFDNQYEIAGVGEDTDLEYRLVANGIKIRNLFYRAVMLHPLHTELPRDAIAYKILENTKQKKQVVALDGYQQAFDKD